HRRLRIPGGRADSRCRADVRGSFLMDLVSEMLGMLDAAIANAGRTFFETTAASVGPLYTAFLTILLVLVGINAALNVYTISMRDAVQLSIRIVLVLLFGLSWANFSALY